jgi:hypothetical protein
LNDDAGLGHTQQGMAEHDGKRAALRPTQYPFHADKQQQQRTATNSNEQQHQQQQQQEQRQQRQQPQQ